MEKFTKVNALVIADVDTLQSVLQEIKSKMKGDYKIQPYSGLWYRRFYNNINIINFIVDDVNKVIPIMAGNAALMDFEGLSKKHNIDIEIWADTGEFYYHYIIMNNKITSEIYDYYKVSLNEDSYEEFIVNNSTIRNIAERVSKREFYSMKKLNVKEVSISPDDNVDNSIFDICGYFNYDIESLYLSSINLCSNAEAVICDIQDELLREGIAYYVSVDKYETKIIINSFDADTAYKCMQKTHAVSSDYTTWGGVPYNCSYPLWSNKVPDDNYDCND